MFLMRKLISLLFVGVILFFVTSILNIGLAQNTMNWMADNPDTFRWNNVATPNADDWNMEWQNQESSSPSWWWRWVCWETKDDDKNYIILNTNVPFVGRCIKKEFDVAAGDTNVSNVFPKLMAYMIRIVMTVLIVWGFLWILVWGFMIASNGAFGSKQTWVKLILGVIAGLILLWASGIILNLINPNFFGTAS